MYIFVVFPWTFREKILERIFFLRVNSSLLKYIFIRYLKLNLNEFILISMIVDMQYLGKLTS